tara:strand:+ start:2234 stop:2536 length:303 start_codon:yes stop_codon:yes gene_type:complete
VETKKDTVEPLDAPPSLNVAATGITPHEHNGRGMPKRVDFRTDKKFFDPMCLKIKLLSTNMDINPEKNIPKSKYGAISAHKNHISLIKANEYVFINSIDI